MGWECFGVCFIGWFLEPVRLEKVTFASSCVNALGNLCVCVCFVGWFLELVRLGRVVGGCN